MFASQFSEIMSTVLRIGQKYDIAAPRVGTPQVDKIIVHLLNTLDKKVDEAKAEAEKVLKELEEERNKQKASMELNKPYDARLAAGEL